MSARAVKPEEAQALRDAAPPGPYHLDGDVRDVEGRRVALVATSHPQADGAFDLLRAAPDLAATVASEPERIAAAVAAERARIVAALNERAAFSARSAAAASGHAANAFLCAFNAYEHAAYIADALADGTVCAPRRSVEEVGRE